MTTSTTPRMLEEVSVNCCDSVGMHGQRGPEDPVDVRSARVVHIALIRVLKNHGRMAAVRLGV